ncbi:PH domain-containing protein [Enterococcus faecalis]|uniref:hypothetical protein n=1 Tax=Enterococcus faecalis TaxID=1351 RepID=UPI001CF351C5|nr:hypothetical protein [Enterococcus faecalis]EJB2753150.1 hypothetical protein [Enterococcus faecalis]EKZ0433770.1 hypothetical protein [Enterococcus faecalis]MCA6711254.1 hypothetical protein [Enterococcus faecalis]MCA6730100.1 hypothetical protein [Enterococcus faecalis]MCU9795343.1 hypothetical protein [Enterococcus faecalis]
MIILTGLVLLGIGTLIGYHFAYLPKLGEWQQRQAIQKYFQVKGNEFTYFAEDEDSYIVSLNNKEYRVKFSLNNPVQVVYAVELEMVEEVFD